MRHKGSISTAVATVTVLAAAGCGADDGAGGMTDATVGGPTTVVGEAAYACTSSIEQPDSEGPVRVIDSGACGYQDALGHVTYGLVVENSGDEPLTNVFVDIEAHDASGASHGRPVPHQIYALAPGQRIGVGYDAVAQGTTPEVVELEVSVNVQNDLEPAEGGGEIQVSDVATAVEGVQRTTTFRLTSTYTQALEGGVALFVVYRDAAGTILGGDDGFVERMDPGATIDQVISSTNINPEITEVEVYVNPDTRPAPA